MPPTTAHHDGEWIWHDPDSTWQPRSTGRATWDVRPVHTKYDPARWQWRRSVVVASGVAHQMPWLKVDDSLHSHPKVLAAGTTALGLWVRCGSWAAQHLTDGHVPDAVAMLYGNRAQAAALVSAGMWTVTDGGWDFSTTGRTTSRPARA